MRHELCSLVWLLNGCLAHRHGVWALATQALIEWPWRAWHYMIVWTGEPPHVLPRT